MAATEEKGGEEREAPTWRRRSRLGKMAAAAAAHMESTAAAAPIGEETARQVCGPG